jgi:hypothetical protein
MWTTVRNIICHLDFFLFCFSQCPCYDHLGLQTLSVPQHVRCRIYYVVFFWAPLPCASRTTQVRTAYFHYTQKAPSCPVVKSSNFDTRYSVFRGYLGTDNAIYKIFTRQSNGSHQAKRRKRYIVASHLVTQRICSVRITGSFGDVRREIMLSLSAALQWHCGFLSPRRFSEGQCWRCSMPSCSSGLGFSLFSSFCLVASTAFSCKKFLLLTGSSPPLACFEKDRHLKQLIMKNYSRYAVRVVLFRINNCVSIIPLL